MSIIEKAVDKLSTHDKPGVDPSNKESMDREIRDNAAAIANQKQERQLDSATVSDHDLSDSTQDPAAAADACDISLKELALEGILAPEGGRSREDEEYRMIKRPHLMRAFAGANTSGGFPNTIMITSALSGEGKTFTSLNLALSMAMEINTTVLLIDSDLAKPNLSRQLGISEHPGFTECLKDETLDIGRYMMKTDVPSLTVLPAGQRHTRATELLTSNNMRTRINELASRYPDRIILFDSPPLLATSESTALAGYMGQVAVVVEYATTPQFLVKEALGMLESKESVSLILNKSRDDFLSRHVSGYSYGYGKGYGYGAYGER